MRRQDLWRLSASCRDTDDPEAFFVTRAHDRPRIDAARALCRSCPAQEQCLNAVLAIPSEHDRNGVFAGLTPQDRRDLREPVAHRTAHARLAEHEHLFGGPDGRAARGTALRHDAQGRVITRGGARRDTDVTHDQAARSG